VAAWCRPPDADSGRIVAASGGVVVGSLGWAVLA
jgi:hypothetical protein